MYEEWIDDEGSFSHIATTQHLVSTNKPIKENPIKKQFEFIEMNRREKKRKKSEDD